MEWNKLQEEKHCDWRYIYIYIRKLLQQRLLRWNRLRIQLHGNVYEFPSAFPSEDQFSQRGKVSVAFWEINFHPRDEKHNANALFALKRIVGFFALECQPGIDFNCIQSIHISRKYKWLANSWRFVKTYPDRI